MTDKASWKPKSSSAWLLTLMASLLAVFMAALAVRIVDAVLWNGLGRIFTLVLFFQLRLFLFVVTVVAAGLSFLVWRYSARMAATAFGMVVILTAIMSLMLANAVWRQSTSASKATRSLHSTVLRDLEKVN